MEGIQAKAKRVLAKAQDCFSGDAGAPIGFIGQELMNGIHVQFGGVGADEEAVLPVFLDGEGGGVVHWTALGQRPFPKLVCAVCLDKHGENGRINDDLLSGGLNLHAS